MLRHKALFSIYTTNWKAPFSESTDRFSNISLVVLAHGHTAAGMPPIFAARGEVIRLLEQLCVRRASDVVSVLPEMVEVVLTCLDKTRLKERGLEFVFPALRQFSAFSTHTRSQKVCVGGINGSLTFFDFKIGRYFVSFVFYKDPRFVPFVRLSLSVFLRKPVFLSLLFHFPMFTPLFHSTFSPLEPSLA
ncbi:hypothetical protein AHF37_04140 [Paragonimus kellicotti]|nr:hypothetical protein AHF37_04140 [Paragonimus kellicotti]